MAIGIIYFGIYALDGTKINEARHLHEASLSLLAPQSSWNYQRPNLNATFKKER